MKIWTVGVVLLLMLVTAACGTTQNSPDTPTPLNPGLFPPPGTTGPNSHTPVVTPLSDGASGPVTLPAGSATAMPLGNSTPLVQPTAGVASQAANTSGNAGSACVTPNGWVAYSVQAGDTLATLAAAHNTTVAQLASANCLNNADAINVGQTIYVPGTTP